jgi:hypothetical protein
MPADLVPTAAADPPFNQMAGPRSLSLASLVRSAPAHALASSTQQQQRTALATKRLRTLAEELSQAGSHGLALHSGEAAFGEGRRGTLAPLASSRAVTSKLSVDMHQSTEQCEKRKHEQPHSCSTISVCLIGAMVVVVCCCLLAFAYASAHAPPDIDTKLLISEPGCSWRKRLVSDWNPFGCMTTLRFSSHSRVGKAVSHADDGACAGPLVDLFYRTHRGDNDAIEIAEAASLVSAVRQHLVDASSLCGHALAKVHVCFGSTTTTERVEQGAVGHFVGCIVEGESDACRAFLCG